MTGAPNDLRPDYEGQAMVLLADMVAKLEAQLDAAKAELDSAKNQAQEVAQRLKETIDERDRIAQERDRYIAENGRLWQRVQHAKDTLAGLFTPPEIAEIRKVRGVEPL